MSPTSSEVLNPYLAGDVVLYDGRVVTVTAVHAGNVFICPVDRSLPNESILHTEVAMVRSNNLPQWHIALTDTFSYGGGDTRFIALADRHFTRDRIHPVTVASLDDCTELLYWFFHDNFVEGVGTSLACGDTTIHLPVMTEYTDTMDDGNLRAYLVEAIRSRMAGKNFNGWVSGGTVVFDDHELALARLCGGQVLTIRDGMVYDIEH